MINPIKEKIKKYMRNGFYFGHNFEITMNAQRRAMVLQQKQLAQQRSRTFIGDDRAMDVRYMWNFNMIKDFKA